MPSRPSTLSGFLLLSIVLHLIVLLVGRRWIARPPVFDVDRTLPPAITIDLAEFKRTEPDLIEESAIEEAVPPEPEPLEETDLAEVMVEEELEDPLYVRNPPPTYPRLARRQGWEGVTILRVDVNARGFVDLIEIVQTSGYSILDDAAVHAVRRWRFTPARVAGQPVNATVEIPIRFELR